MATNVDNILLIESLLMEPDHPDLLGLIVEQEDDDDVLLLHNGGDRREHVPRVATYMQDTVSDYTDDDFKKQFRINKVTFSFLKECLRETLEVENVGGHKPISLDKKILATIWYLANQSCMREVSNLFGMSKSTTHDLIKVAKLI